MFHVAPPVELVSAAQRRANTVAAERAGAALALIEAGR